MKQIARELGVSPASVYNWTSNIQLTDEQRYRNTNRACDPESLARRGREWAEECRRRRLVHQEAGRERARASEPLHMAGCMLYWAEGSKSRNCLQLVNSDLELQRFFMRFLRCCFVVPDSDCRVGLKFYTGNGVTTEQIERHWLDGLLLPETALRRHIIDCMPTSSSGLRRYKIPYGVCTLAVSRSTWLIQHIYGAIQEYGGFSEPAWLD